MDVHVRSDEGLQRGSRAISLPPLDPRRTDNQQKLPDDLDLDAIIARISAGELMSIIAREMGVTPQALSARLLKHPQYLTAKESGHEARLDQAEEWCESSANALELARARDVWRARSWRASVEVPRRWGQQAPAIAINANGPVQVQVVSWGVAQIAAAQPDGQVIDSIDGASHHVDGDEK